MFLQSFKLTYENISSMGDVNLNTNTLLKVLLSTSVFVDKMIASKTKSLKI